MASIREDDRPWYMQARSSRRATAYLSRQMLHLTSASLEDSHLSAGDSVAITGTIVRDGHDWSDAAENPNLGGQEGARVHIEEMEPGQGSSCRAQPLRGVRYE